MHRPAPRLVVGAVVMDDLASPTKVLAARRLGGSAHAIGRWEFPGGKVEPGEAPRDALVRELREELEVEVELGEEVVNPDARTWPISERFEMRLWRARVVSGEPVAGHAHTDVRWLDRSSLRSVDWLAADLAVLPHVFGD